MGNSINISRTYNPRGWITAKTDGSVYNFSISSYANNGNVVAASDNNINGNWTYTYDEFNRLATAASNVGKGCSWAYDRFGNRLQQSPYGTGNSCPAPQYNSDGNNHMTGSGYNYDAAGNLTMDPFHSYTYDAENRLVSIDNGSAISYVYDAFDRRVRAGASDYIFDLNGHATYEVSSGIWSRGEVWAANWHLATYSGGTTNFEHTDWLNTVRARSGVTGSSSATCTSLPFGDSPNCTTFWSPIGFTGLENDYTILNHAYYRQYSNLMGRWMTPDPAGMAAVDSGNPQTWNRYAYVMNNPANLIDPSGLDDEGIWVNAFCQADPIFCAATPAAAHEFCVFIGLCGDGSSGNSGGGGSAGGSSGGGATAPTPIPSGNHPIGGSWPNGETNGIPTGFSAGGPNLCQLLGVCRLDSGCDFGVCQFQSSTAAWPRVVLSCAAIPGCQSVLGLLGALGVLLMQKGDAVPYDPRTDLPQSIQEKLADCTPGAVHTEPATGKGYKGGISWVQEFVCPTGIVEVHWITVNGKVVHGPHPRFPGSE